MKQNTKDWIQYSSAIAMLLSAIILAAVSFHALREIHSSVIAYVGEAIAFAAAVYGIALYTQNEIRRQFRRMKRDNITPPEEIEEDDDDETEA